MSEAPTNKTVSKWSVLDPGILLACGNQLLQSNHELSYAFVVVLSTAVKGIPFCNHGGAGLEMSSQRAVTCSSSILFSGSAGLSRFTSKM